MERRSSPVIVCITGIAVITLLYVGAYFADVKAVRPYFIMGCCPPWSKHAEYRFGGEIATTVFRPVHSIDRRIRPDHWLLYDTYDEFIPAYKLVDQSVEYDDPHVEALSVELAELIRDTSMLLQREGDPHKTPSSDLRSKVEIVESQLRIAMQSAKKKRPLTDAERGVVRD